MLLTNGLARAVARRPSCSLVLLLIVLLSACAPQLRTISVGKYELPTKREPLAVSFEVPHFYVDYNSGETSFRAEDEPRMMDELEDKLRASFMKSGFLRTVDNDAVGHLRVSVEVRGVSPNGVVAWAIIDGLLVVVPSLLGAPISWRDFETIGIYELLDARGAVIWQGEVMNKQRHYQAFYYGHRDISEPYRKSMRTISLEIIKRFEAERPDLEAKLGTGNRQGPPLRIRPRRGRVGIAQVAQPFPSAAAVHKTTVAVMPVHDEHRLLKKGLDDRMTDYIRIRMGSAGRFVVIDKSRQKKSLKDLIRKEKKESYKQCYDATCQIPLGMALSADSILRTSVTRFGDVHTLSLELVDLAKEAVIATATADCDGSETGFKVAIEVAVGALASQR